MEPTDDKSSPGGAETPAPARTLGLRTAALFIALLVIVLVPVAFFPVAGEYVDYLSVFSYPKFEVLRVLSLPLLVVVLLDKNPRMVPVLIPALAFLGVSILSTLFSEDAAFTLVGDRFDGLIPLGAGVLLFYATARFLDSRARVRVFLAAGVATAVLISAYGILQSFELDPVPRLLEVPWPVGGRAFSTLAGPVGLAAYLTLMMGVTLALYFLAERRFARGLCLVALAIIGACWLSTYTRGAMLGVGVALLIVLWLAHRRLGSVRPLLLPLAVLALAMLVTQLTNPQATDPVNRVWAANPPFWEEIPTRPTGGEDANVVVARLLSTQLAPTEDPPVPPVEKAPPDQPSGRESSVTSRLWIWRDTIPMILDRPLLGHGPSNFAAPFERYQGEDLRAYTDQTPQFIDKAHNEFLQVAATTGLLGLAAYLWIFVSYFRGAYRSGGWVLLALSGGVLAYILQIQTAFTTTTNGTTFWAILGASVAVMRIQDRGAADGAPGSDSTPADFSSARSAPE